MTDLKKDNIDQIAYIKHFETCLKGFDEILKSHVEEAMKEYSFFSFSRNRMQLLFAEFELAKRAAVDSSMKKTFEMLLKHQGDVVKQLHDDALIYYLQMYAIRFVAYLNIRLSNIPREIKAIHDLSRGISKYAEIVKPYDIYACILIWIRMPIVQSFTKFHEDSIALLNTIIENNNKIINPKRVFKAIKH